MQSIQSADNNTFHLSSSKEENQIKSNKNIISDNLYFIRGLAIFLVVIGHVIGNDQDSGILKMYSSDIPLLSSFCRFIYTFHVALFFISSGLTFGIFSNHEINLSKFFKSRFQRLMIPLLIWAPISYLFRGFLNKTGFSALGIIESVLKPTFIFWFFHALIFASIFSFLWMKFFKSKISYFLVSITLFCTVLGLNRIFDLQFLHSLENTYLFWNLFYAAGLALSFGSLAKFNEIIRASSKFIIPVISLICIGLMIASAYFIPQKYIYLIKLINGSLAFAFLYASSTILQTDSSVKKQIMYWGQLSMIIYLFHTYFGAAIRVILVKFGVMSPSLHLFVGTVISMFGPILLYKLFHNKFKPFDYSIGESK